VIAALELDRRMQRAAGTIAYLAINVVLAVLSIVAVLGFALGAALSVVRIGLPVLLAAAAACRWILGTDRRAANRFLGMQIPPLPAAPRTSGSSWERSLAILSDRMLLRAVAILAAKPLLIGLLVAVALVPLLLLFETLELGVQGVAGLGSIDYLGPWELGVGLGLVLLLLAPFAAVLLIATLEALHTVLCTIGRALVAQRLAPGGPVREALAVSLGDRSVAVAYWLPDRQEFVDESGRPVELPEPGSGRTWTTVESNGVPVAAIVHDAALDTSRELVEAAASASLLAIDNERLKADLRARLEELRVSRLRIVEAADDARRRIERDLHDGAQQELLALALELRVLRSRMGDSNAEPLIDGIAERLDVALGELRELARGIHPAILTQSGLTAAVGALAERATLPVEMEIGVERRLPAQVEAAAYFLVAEALTNVSRYARATGARVTMAMDDGELVVCVSDDGIGGVDVAAGSGLRGLQDRLATVEGTMDIDSPPGEGTRLTGRIPVAG
jgi:signal transduction histidine kinase